MKRYTEKALENNNQKDLEAEFKSIVERVLNVIKEVSPKVEELFSDEAFSMNHKLASSFKNLDPIKGNKKVKEQLHSWLIHQMNNMSKTVEGIKKTVEHVEKNA